MRNYQYLVNSRLYFRRLSRDPFSLLIFVVLPVGIASILSFIYSRNADEEIYVLGYNMVSSQLSLNMMLLFQFNAGIYLLNYLNDDLFNPMKWRLRASPCPVHVMVFAGSAICIVFSVIQGLLVVGFTAWFLDAYWGTLWITVLIIFIVSVIAQFMSMTLFLLVRKLSLAENLSWVITWIMAILAGMMFSLPDNAFFRFMKEYGTPYSLAHTVIVESGFLSGEPGFSMKMWISLAVLTAFTAIFSVIIIGLGRRKLA